MRLGAHVPDPRAASVVLTVLVVVWAVLARQTSEHWWWVAALDLIPPQLLLPAFAGLVWLAWRAGQVGWVFPGAHPVVAAPITLLSLNTLDASADPARIAAPVQWETADVVVLQEAVFKDHPEDVYAAQVRAAFPSWRAGRCVFPKRVTPCW